METKHTPGPWTSNAFAREPDCEYFVAGPEGQWLADVGGGEDYVDHSSMDTQRANARLIAAAPDLLAACEAVLDMVESEGRDTGRGGAFSDMRDAIAKATGAA